MNEVEIDRCALFARLRRMWLDTGDGRTNRALADLMGVRYQKVTDYATSVYRPPDRLVLWLLDVTGSELVVCGDRAILRLAGGRADGSSDLATFKHVPER